MRETRRDLAPDDGADGVMKLERSLLKDQALERLRDSIVSGRMRPGAKLVERDLAALLGISRAPVRDALLQLETERLVVSKPSGRHVARLSEQDIRELYQVRRVLEKLAVELATQNRSPQGQALLTAKLEQMRTAITRGDRLAYIKNDVETHRAIWQLANNAWLHDTLDAMLGPISMFVSGNATYHNWQETLQLHEQLVACISTGDTRGAVRCVEQHMDNALQGALGTIQSAEGAPRPLPS